LRIVFSRKGFDSTAGGAPSPIINGRPISLPIPSKRSVDPSYASVGHGAAVKTATRGKLTGRHKCHDDPMFADGHVWFGQCGAAQGHLEKLGVDEGDVFLFFGLFADEATGERHHRIFGYQKIVAKGAPGSVNASPHWRDPPRSHPHFVGDWPRNNTIWFGTGSTARHASADLRLTRPDGPLNTWIVPPWLRRLGLTYHANPARWLPDGTLDSARRGQEFVCDIGQDKEAQGWLASIVALIETD